MSSDCLKTHADHEPTIGELRDVRATIRGLKARVAEQLATIEYQRDVIERMRRENEAERGE